jgi:hypothetical protein
MHRHHPVWMWLTMKNGIAVRGHRREGSSSDVPLRLLSDGIIGNDDDRNGWKLSCRETLH